jgi:hypothetical protein
MAVSLFGVGPGQGLRRTISFLDGLVGVSLSFRHSRPTRKCPAGGSAAYGVVVDRVNVSVLP